MQLPRQWGWRLFRLLPYSWQNWLRPLPRNTWMPPDPWDTVIGEKPCPLCALTGVAPAMADELKFNNLFCRLHGLIGERYDLAVWTDSVEAREEMIRQLAFFFAAVPNQSEKPDHYNGVYIGVSEIIVKRKVGDSNITVTFRVADRSHVKEGCDGAESKQSRSPWSFTREQLVQANRYTGWGKSASEGVIDVVTALGAAHFTFWGQRENDKRIHPDSQFTRGFYKWHSEHHCGLIGIIARISWY